MMSSDCFVMFGPCPVCGSRDRLGVYVIVRADGVRGGTSIKCGTCGAVGPRGDIYTAVIRWNEWDGRSSEDPSGGHVPIQAVRKYRPKSI